MSAVKTICAALERIAPTRLAEKWDNVSSSSPGVAARLSGRAPRSDCSWVSESRRGTHEHPGVSPNV